MSQFDIFTNPVASANSSLFEAFILPVKTDTAVGILNRISTFQLLKNNWDGYGAVPPELNAIINARRFVELMPEIILRTITAHDVSVTPYGTITFEWAKGEDSIVVEIGNSKIGIVTDFNNDPEVILDSVIFDGQSINNVFIKAYFELF